MGIQKSWFEVHHPQPHLYVIRERLDELDSRFFTEYTNLYLIKGTTSALLIDTGSGIGDLSSLIDTLIGDKDLVVINTHNHFDHVGSNHQFDETHIHRFDFKKLMFPMDVSFLNGSESDLTEYYQNQHWKIDFATSQVPLIGNEEFNLGGLIVNIFYTPGHTPGSICLVTDRNEVFTGDTLHYGAVFLPGLDQIPYYVESLKVLGSKLKELSDPVIYPGHEDYGVTTQLFNEFMVTYQGLDQIPGKYDSFLEATVHRSGKFIFVKPTEKAAAYQQSTEESL